MVACEGPVGIGKTTAVVAWCIRRAITSGARRIFVVAPYTTILSQTAAMLRSALLLPDEQGRDNEIVAEHHHRADFQAMESRDLAVLWRAPVIVTTGVHFVETLAACEPARLRKLHGLPGSVVFLDEAHAALPAPLWRQNWVWMRELAGEWGCSFVFASGSLARVWQEPDIVGENDVLRLPDVAPPAFSARLDETEHARVRFRTVGRTTNPVSLILNAPGPRLAVFNTVQTAAVMAKRLREAEAKVLHLSTALCPLDRDSILDEVKRRLDPKSSYDRDWTLVATSLVEAGVDLFFRTALRERFSTASLIQIGGRANRHGGEHRADVIDFQVEANDGLTCGGVVETSASKLNAPETWVAPRSGAWIETAYIPVRSIILSRPRAGAWSEPQMARIGIVLSASPPCGGVDRNRLATGLGTAARSDRKLSFLQQPLVDRRETREGALSRVGSCERS